MSSKNIPELNYRDMLFTWRETSKEKRWQEFKNKALMAGVGVGIFACGVLCVLVSIRLAYTPM